MFIRTDCRSQWYISFTNGKGLLVYAIGSYFYEQRKFGTREAVFILQNCNCSAYSLLSEIKVVILIFIFRHRELKNYFINQL